MQEPFSEHKQPFSHSRMSLQRHRSEDHENAGRSLLLKDKQNIMVKCDSAANLSALCAAISGTETLVCHSFAPSTSVAILCTPSSYLELLGLNSLSLSSREGFHQGRKEALFSLGRWRHLFILKERLLDVVGPSGVGSQSISGVYFVAL